MISIQTTYSRLTFPYTIPKWIVEPFPIKAYRLLWLEICVVILVLWYLWYSEGDGPNFVFAHFEENKTIWLQDYTSTFANTTAVFPFFSYCRASQHLRAHFFSGSGVPNVHVMHMIHVACVSQPCNTSKNLGGSWYKERWTGTVWNNGFAGVHFLTPFCLQ